MLFKVKYLYNFILFLMLLLIIISCSNDGEEKIQYKIPESEENYIINMFNTPCNQRYCYDGEKRYFIPGAVMPHILSLETEALERGKDLYVDNLIIQFTMDPQWFGPNNVPIKCILKFQDDNLNTSNMLKQPPILIINSQWWKLNEDAIKREILIYHGIGLCVIFKDPITVTYTYKNESLIGSIMDLRLLNNTDQYMRYKSAYISELLEWSYNLLDILYIIEEDAWSN